MAMRSGASFDVGEQPPPIPGPAPLMPSRESFARTYYASMPVSSFCQTNGCRFPLPRKLLTSREHVGNGIFLCRAGWASDDTGPSRWSFSWPFSRCLSRYFGYWSFSWRFFCSFYWAFRKSAVAYFCQGRSRDPDPEPISRVVGLPCWYYVDTCVFVLSRYYVDTSVLVLVCRDLIMYEFIYIFVYGTCNEFMCMACINLYIFLSICTVENSKTANKKKTGAPIRRGQGRRRRGCRMPKWQGLRRGLSRRCIGYPMPRV
jgi:hypothetical protein